MTTTRAFLILGVAAIAGAGSTALGGAPMGPPIALLGEGQWAIGGEYGREEISLQGGGLMSTVFQLEGAERFDFVELQEIEDVEMNMFFATLAYGVCDNWDIFVRLGAADAQDDASAVADVTDYGVTGEYSLGTLDSSYGFAWGVGTRATFCRSGPWSFGGLMQVTWFEPDDSDIDYLDPVSPPPPQGVHVGEASIDWMQAQVALAAAYQMDTVQIWAGPFLQFIDGDFDRSGDIFFDTSDLGDFDASSEIKEEAQFGGHAGLLWAASDQLDLWVEGQITGDSWLVGVGLLWMPGQGMGK